MCFGGLVFVPRTSAIHPALSLSGHSPNLFFQTFFHLSLANSPIKAAIANLGLAQAVVRSVFSFWQVCAPFSIVSHPEPENPFSILFLPD